MSQQKKPNSMVAVWIEPCTATVPEPAASDAPAAIDAGAGWSVRCVDPAAGWLRLDDAGVTRGDGVFETLLYRRGRIRSVIEHLARMERSAAALALEIPPAAVWERAIALGLDAFLGQDADGEPEASIRCVATRGAPGTGPACFVTLSPVPARDPDPKPIKVLTLDRGYDSGAAQRAPWLLLGAKTLSYAVNVAALTYAKKHGADDAIFVTSDGLILDGLTASVVASYRSGEGSGQIVVRTPSVETGGLAGTTVAAVSEAARALGWEVEAVPMRPADLLTADALWLASSVKMLRPVSHVDGVEVGVDAQLHRILSHALEQTL
ncbi:aminotransferase class IV [Pseudoglutamicibacter albus]|uniref:aminotransferase class IV n=1 Tax=Pseudoglutamicibacter albus TaxID=98671 RepID=UPI001EF4843D|nr:aminotransferase class IV [Pseudoglutamicibacter albus]MCG7304021.1 aminotransferase class IV [Pseudoglutamicibacter albus]